MTESSANSGGHLIIGSSVRVGSIFELMEHDRADCLVPLNDVIALKALTDKDRTDYKWRVRGMFRWAATKKKGELVDICHRVNTQAEWDEYIKLATRAEKKYKADNSSEGVSVDGKWEIRKDYRMFLVFAPDYPKTLPI